MNYEGSIIFTSLNISASGLSAQRSNEWKDSSIANANATRTDSVNHYRRKIAVMETENTPDFDGVEIMQSWNWNQSWHFLFSQHNHQLEQNNYNSVQANIEEDQSDFQDIRSRPSGCGWGGLRPETGILMLLRKWDMINASRIVAKLWAASKAKDMAKWALDIWFREVIEFFPLIITTWYADGWSVYITLQLLAFCSFKMPYKDA